MKASDSVKESQESMAPVRVSSFPPEDYRALEEIYSAMEASRAPVVRNAAEQLRKS